MKVKGLVKLVKKKGGANAVIWKIPNKWKVEMEDRLDVINISLSSVMSLFFFP